MYTLEVKDYTINYDDHLKIVDTFAELQAPSKRIRSKRSIATLSINERERRRLDAARVIEANSVSNLGTCRIEDKIAVHAQAVALTAALAPPAIVATTPILPAPPATSVTPENKIMKRRLPEPRDGWKDSVV